jgi:hypothetical protein
MGRSKQYCRRFGSKAPKPVRSGPRHLASAGPWHHRPNRNLPFTAQHKKRGSQEPRGQDSFIKARYALTLLRVAQTADRETAARLIRGLARDPPLPDEVPELAGIHLRAIEAFVRLAAGLADARSSSQQQRLWNEAQDATKDWLATLNAQQ